MAAERSSHDILPVVKLKNSYIYPRSSSHNALSIRNLPAIFFVSIYGLICYRIGALSRSMDQQLVEMEDPAAQHARTTSQITPMSDSHLPYRCGIVFFYHIPSTGGVSTKYCRRMRKCRSNRYCVRCMPSQIEFYYYHSFRAP